MRVSCDVMAASNHCLAFVAEERWRHLAAFFPPGQRVDTSEAALAWRWLAGARWSARTPWATSAAPPSGASGGGL